MSTGEALNQPQELPENWGPIFGMPGIQDRLGDLSWLGEFYADQGWFVVGNAPAIGDPPGVITPEAVKNEARERLRNSDWTMLSDVPLTIGQKQKWIDYRKALREVDMQSGFPAKVIWPAMPE